MTRINDRYKKKTSGTLRLAGKAISKPEFELDSLISALVPIIILPVYAFRI